MAGIRDIQMLLQDMNPVLERTEYVFCTKACFQIDEDIVALRPIATFLESEGMTCVVSKVAADAQRLSYEGIFYRITLEVHSSLEAVGLTAAISTALASRKISANVIAAYYHDHIFVPKDDAELALETLKGLTQA